MPMTVLLLGDGPPPPLPDTAQVLRAPTRGEGLAKTPKGPLAVFDTRYQAGAQWGEAAAAGRTAGGHVLPGDNYGWADWLYYVMEYGWKPHLAAGNIVYTPEDRHNLDEWGPLTGIHDPRMDVRLRRGPAFTAYLRERYALSFRWGAAHVHPAAALLRLGLPVLVLVRTPWWRRPATLPGVAIMSLVMACGEMAGSLTGRSGKVNAG